MAKSRFSDLLLSDAFLLLSFIFSDPLYLACLMLLSPFLLKLLSFLYPLLFTTCLLIAADTFSGEFPFPLLLACGDSEDEMVRRYERGDGFQVFVFEEGYEALFGEDDSMERIDGVVEDEVKDVKMDCFSDSVAVVKTATAKSRDEEDEKESKINFFKLLSEFEKKTTNLPAAKPTSPPPTLTKTQSDSSEKFHQSSAAGSLDEEGMDSLWEETYVAERRIPVMVAAAAESKKKNKKKNKCQSETSDEEEDDDDAAIPAGELCGLLGLKLSSGKMKRSVGRRNLAKISKVVKGIRWLSHVSKKVHDDAH